LIYKAKNAIKRAEAHISDMFLAMMKSAGMWAALMAFVYYKLGDYVAAQGWAAITFLIGALGGLWTLINLAEGDVE
jgi:hypothetical protein